jgi:hypothetical protein
VGYIALASSLGLALAPRAAPAQDQNPAAQGQGPAAQAPTLPAERGGSPWDIPSGEGNARDVPRGPDWCVGVHEGDQRCVQPSQTNPVPSTTFRPGGREPEPIQTNAPGPQGLERVTPADQQ